MGSQEPTETMLTEPLININPVDKDGWTSLHSAAQTGEKQPEENDTPLNL